MISLKDLVINTLSDYKYTLGSLAASSALCAAVNYFSSSNMGIKDALIVGVPTVLSALVVDPSQKRKKQLESILSKADTSRESGVVSLDQDGNIKSFIGGKGNVFEELNFRAKPGENIKDKYSQLEPGVSEFFETARKDLLARYENAKKDIKLLDQFNSKEAYGRVDPVVGRCLKRKGTFGNTYIKTTYELDAFLSNDNKTVKIKARRLVDDSEVNILNDWLDEKVIADIRRNPKKYDEAIESPTACLFCDIRGSTQVWDNSTGKGVRDFTNQYYEQLIESAIGFDPTFDKVVGDEIVLLFGPPYDEIVPHQSMLTPVYNSINSAINMRESFERIKNGFDIGVGIGIDFGTPFVGIYGYRKRRTYTAMGRTMNQGARLCSKAGRGEIIVSKSAVDNLEVEKQHVDVSSLVSRLVPSGSISVKGVGKPIEIYKVQ